MATKKTTRKRATRKKTTTAPAKAAAAEEVKDATPAVEEVTEPEAPAEVEATSTTEPEAAAEVEATSTTESEAAAEAEAATEKIEVVRKDNVKKVKAHPSLVRATGLWLAHNASQESSDELVDACALAASEGRIVCVCKCGKVVISEEQYADRAAVRRVSAENTNVLSFLNQAVADVIKDTTA